MRSWYQQLLQLILFSILDSKTERWEVQISYMYFLECVLSHARENANRLSSF